ncbi:hypothetical protein FQN54_002852 [Arachnomyces sp. PD_36]|nr:hypothetical protein FQN54_002852 [Arachnomyces sp. PD_36]
MEARHVVRCLRANPSSSVSAIARSRTMRPSFFQGQCTEAHSQKLSSTIPSGRRYLSTSEPQRASSEPWKTKAENPPTQFSESSPSNPAKDSASNADKLGEVTNILNQLGMRKPKPSSRALDLDSLFPENLGSMRSPSISQLSDRVKTSLSQSDPFKPPKINLRLGPSLGRTVAVDPGKGFDVTRAIRTMEVSCARNKVRAQEREQKFYMRRGQRRKDLKSQRWRKLFLTSFQNTLHRCQQMRQQGW